MPLSDNEARSHSVLETSLTELAFTFFFILAIFASWKISDAAQELTKQEEITQELTDQVSELVGSLNEASKFAELGEKFDPAELFIELNKGKEAAHNLEKAKEKQKTLEAEIEKYSSLIGDQPELDLDDIAQKMSEFQKIQQILEKDGLHPDESVLDKIKKLRTSVNDMIGQNANIRNKLEALGNGLDHPPCWANPTTGKIEYVFDIVINESNLEVHKGWLESRNEQALSNPNIMKSIGNHSKNVLLWESTAALFEESKVQKCRHFVRVYDHSESKKAFKSYLLGIENHFYKYLSRSTYE